MYHEAVMVNEALEGLSVKAGGVYVDTTFGGGGHSMAILKELEKGRLIAFDQDEDACKNLPDDERILFLNHNFKYMKNLLKWHGCIPVDGILADLGVSSHQIDSSHRGFSTRFDGPLDMRMNQQAAKSAKDVVNNYEADRLADVFFLYGELRDARRIAGTIEEARAEKPVETTRQLTSLLKKFAPRGREMKYFAQVFQALRIEVNDEMEVLKDLLVQSTRVLKKGGRLVIISYHSLEDRMVKNFMKAGNIEGKIEKDLYGNFYAPFIQKGKAKKAGEQEIRNNSRARSAILRTAEKV